MNLDATLAGNLVTALFLAPMLVAIVTDLRSLRIPNLVNAALVLAFPIAALLSPQPIEWWSHLAGGAALLVAGFTMFAFHLIGGGDAKMLAAVGLWFGLDLLLPLVVVITLVGGGVALALLALRSPLVVVPLAAHLGKLPGLFEKGGPIPYALAIAGGSLLMMKQLPLL